VDAFDVDVDELEESDFVDELLSDLVDDDESDEVELLEELDPLSLLSASLVDPNEPAERESVL
jgi:hypothetical protein